MDVYFSSRLIVFAALLVVSIFFSAVETCLLSLPRAILARKAEEGGLLGLAFREWKKHPNRILTSILLGNNTVVILATVLASYAAVHLAETYGWSKAVTASVTSIVVTVSIVVFAEAIPKVVARSYSAKMADLLIIPIYLFDKVTMPLTWAFMQFVGKLMPSLSKASVALVTEEDIKHMVEVGEAEGAIQEEERNMIRSVLDFTDTKVQKVMIPRTEMFCVDITTPMDRLIDLLIEKGYSRVPVIKGGPDNIVGILHSRDLLSIWKHKDLIVLQDLLRKPFFVPETMRVDRLLQEFKKGKMHMAIVADEYGGTAGLVTLEDLVEEIFGEIKDEHEGEGEGPVVKQEDGSWLAEGGVSLDEFNDILSTQLAPKGEVASLAGYLLEKCGRFPRKGRVIEDREAVFTILEATDKKITKVKVVKREVPLAPDDPALQPKPRKKRVKVALAVEEPVAEPSLAVLDKPEERS